MKQLTLEEMHQVLFRMLVCIHEYCIANNIRYSLGGGTLLGAIRHRGFIPWDDDADIMMPRPDYERFLQGFPAYIAQHIAHYKLQHWRNQKDYPHLYAKVYDDRTRLEGAKHLKGLSVDVFPIDGLPPVSKQKRYRDWYSRSRIFEHVQRNPFGSLTWKRKLFAVITYPLWCFIPAEKFMACTEKYLQKYPFQTSEYAGCTVGTYGMAEFMQADTFRQYIDVPFEGLPFRAIADYHSYLTQHYGDYMQMPSEEKCKTKHQNACWWNVLSKRDNRSNSFHQQDKTKYMKRNIVITGGAGFIGSHVVRLFVNKYPDYKIINLDKLTYAGNLANLKDIEDRPNYKFVKMDICDFEAFYQLMQDEQIDGIIHLAAESHVDRSIKDPFTFARTNVMGTLSLLQAAKLYWESLPEKYEGKRFYHISTDEVYGALEMTNPEGIAPSYARASEGKQPPFTTKASSGEHHLAYGKDFFYETTKYNPHSPYSASKASSDHFVRAFHDTYGMPTIVTNCSNNYGPYQFPEKLIPLFINNIRHRKPLPVYGKGENVRDWLYVVDHARAIDTIFHNGTIAETYNIGGFNEWKNIDIIKTVIATVDRLLGRPEGADLDLITYVTDRLGHDARYAIDSTKLQRELGWEPSLQFEEGIEKTVKWYLDNEEWLDNVTSGDYLEYYNKMYNN